MRFIYILVSVFLLFACGANEKPTQTNMDLIIELEDMARKDQTISLVQVNDEFKRMRDSLIEVNTSRLKEIIDEHGFTGTHLVGNSGSRKAMLIALHSNDEDFKNEYLELLEEAVEEGDANPEDLKVMKEKMGLEN
ncbi:DUF6624 domain-containing protein [Jiulongibacter sp. NS-SX5]|uniref:DUF6624 domain-containing protein n=1 Tax=Jiulongibacter sp. NS-SX5 TaxID=3463854 RepID=UPI00405813D1